MKYYVVVQAPACPLDAERFAVESAFAIHLRELRALIGPEFEELVLIGPAMSAAQYGAASSGMTVMSPAETGVRFLPAFPLEMSRATFLLRRLVPTWFWLRRLFAAPCVVHSGMSTELARPLMFMASLAGRSMHRPVMFVVDMDFRMHARRLRATGAWSLRSYVLNRCIYDPMKWIQLRLAPYLFDVCSFKGETLVRDFGRGRPNVRAFHDTVHAASHVIDAAALEERIRWIQSRPRELAAVYFGRLVSSKGVDRIIDAVDMARQQGAAVRLSIIGDGPAREALQSRARERRLEGQIDFIDPVPWGEPLFRLLDRQQVCVMAPLIEDTPRAAFDAFCRGLPVVSFDIAYFRDLAHESGAVVTTPWPDPAGLARALAGLADDPVEMVRLSRNAVRFAAENTQQAWLKRRLGWLRAVFAQPPQ